MNKLTICLAAGLGLTAATTPQATPAAAAELPTGAVLASTWKVLANNSIFLLQAESQGGDGSGCTPITGYIYPVTSANTSNTDTISGSYCSATRQIGFYRNDAQSHATNQVYDGVIGAGGMLTGSFTSFAGGDNSGEFPFWGKVWGPQ
jgi:cation transporter-like permease